MSGNITQFVDFQTSSGDTGESNDASIQPIVPGEQVTSAVQGRPDQHNRRRTEALRAAAADSAYLRDADRSLIIAGPGKVTWPGSTTAVQSGILTLNDVLWILPMLTPGSAQTAPVPPVASVFGTLHLKRASDSANAILVTSQRRSYAAGDWVNVTIAAGVSFSCVLDVEDAGSYRRTIKIVATPSTTLGTVISALNGLTPPAPDNTQLVTAALEGGALSGDVVLSPQARQFTSGNYDGEGHALTPANLASFFSSNPSEVLAEGDTLCAQFAMLVDTASTGGRRQAVPENSNTPITAGMLFNSRVHPEKLVNALPICKVVNGSLVFATGAEIPAGSSNVGLSEADVGSRILRNGGFEAGATSQTARYQIVDWENRPDLATNGAWRVSTTSPRSGAKHLELNKTSTSATVARIDQHHEVPVSPGQAIRIVAYARQLIAPTAGTYSVVLYWGDANSDPSSSSSVALQVLSATDGAYRRVDQTITVPSGKRFLKTISIEAAGVTSATTGVALYVDDVQTFVETLSEATPSADAGSMRAALLSAILLGDPATYDVAEEQALLHYESTTPSGEGQIHVEHKSQGTTAAPAIALYGRLLALGSRLLSTAANARLPRVVTPFTTGGTPTLILESKIVTGTAGGIRVYQLNESTESNVAIVMNASFDGTNWNKDEAGARATMLEVGQLGMRLWFRDADAAWPTWTKIAELAGPEATTVANPDFRPLLSLFDSAGNRRAAFDHLGLARAQSALVIHQNWIAPMYAAWFDDNNATGTNAAELDVASDKPSIWLHQACPANADRAGKRSPRIVNGPWNADLLGVAEFAIDSTDLAGTPNAVYQIGWIHDEVTEPSSEDFIKLSKTSASANWRFLTNGGAGPTNVDTGVAATGVQRFRMEVYGSNWPGGQRALLYVNGALVAESTTNFPVDDPMAFLSYLKSTGATNVDVYVSPITVTMIRRPADDAV